MGERLGLGAESANHRALSLNPYQWESVAGRRVTTYQGKCRRTFAESAFTPSHRVHVIH